MRLGLSKIHDKQSNTALTTPRSGDAIYRRLRLLEGRIRELEAQGSTLRRDVSRIDRKVYREDKSSLATDLGMKPVQYLDPAVWGNGG